MPNQNVNVEVASYTQGGQFQPGAFRTLGDVLREYNVDMSEAVVDITDSEGNEKNVTAAGLLAEGDTIIIMKSKNKSGQ